MPRLLFALFFCAFAAFPADANLNGLKVRYESAGSGKQDIILIHGWACDRSFLAEQAKDLARGHRVVSLDLPGHGASDPFPNLTMDLFAQSVEAVRAAGNLERPVLIGHSLGATVARQYARLYPGKAAALIFLDGSIFQLPAGEANQARWSEMIVNLAKSFGPANPKQARERSISQFLASMYSDSTPRPLQMSILSKILATRPETCEAAMKSFAELSLWKEDRLEIPVFAIRAGKRPPPGEELYLRGLFSPLRYLYFPDVSHFLPQEKPAEVNALIREFLRSSKL
jgi:pimeloyl-ACP methyl ester carboxylesterase